MRHWFALAGAALIAAGCSSTSGSSSSGSSAPAPKPAEAPKAAPAPKPAPAPAAETPKAAPAIGATLPAGSIVLDNEDTDGSVKWKGAWNEDPAGGDHGLSCHWTTPDPDGKAQLIWSTTLPKAGNWHVYVWHGQDPVNDHATDAPFTVEYDGGKQCFKINEKDGFSTWKPLGTFKFAKDKPAMVVLSNNANSNVIGDAVLFVPE